MFNSSGLWLACALQTPQLKGRQMKTTAEYLELALKFELLATFEENLSLKADLEKQSAAYRKLAATGLENTRLEKPRDSS
jgi:hypothetical protein